MKETDELSCDIFHFISKFRNELAIHMTRKHFNIEQIDGNVDIDSEVNSIVKIDRNKKSKFQTMVKS